MRWWEKTVEYAYVLNSIGKKIFVAPLDGKDERRGDAILASVEGWVLVEFKRDEDSIKSERDKYYHYEKAAEAMKTRCVSHFVVYGHKLGADINSMESLELLSKYYFPGEDREGSFNVDYIITLGSPQAEFEEYVKDLLKYKKKGDEVDQGSGGLIAGVCGDQHNGKIVTMTVDEFAEHYNLKYESGMKHG